jgi:hypothetical protein
MKQPLLRLLKYIPLKDIYVNCYEDSIHYVASKPIDLSNTAMYLLKEHVRFLIRLDQISYLDKKSILEDNRAT